MRNQIISRNSIGGICAALLLGFGGKATANPPIAPPAEDAVVLTGWLHVEDHTMADVVLEVLVNGTIRNAEVSESGRFSVSLPANVEATLRFEKPGHLSKEVLVDTRHAADGSFEQRTRRLKFAVIMQQERHMGNWTYNGPVGSIGFEQGGGCVAVQHDRNLVPADRHKPMVF
ncbi:MAG: hypothetical protein WEC15_00395 [Flavobacteriales bacterium]